MSCPFTCSIRRTMPALFLMAALVVMLAAPRPVRAAPASMTYTGQLLTSLSPPTAASGSYDMKFQLYTAATGGLPFGAPVSLTSVPVVSGLYYVQLYFGSLFTGATYWIQVSYRPAGSAAAYTLVPPRPIAPDAAYANYATLSGTTQGLQSQGVSVLVPTAGQALVYDGRLWSPTTLPAPAAYVAGAGLSLSGGTFSIPGGGVTDSMLALPLSLSASSASSILDVTNPGSGPGIQGNSTSNAGVVGRSGSGSGADFSSTTGFGLSAIGGNIGVYGAATTAGGRGMDGNAIGTGSVGVSGTSDSGYGVVGSGNTGMGVYGTSNGSDGGHFLTTGGANGLYGEAQTPSGTGILGVANTGTYATGVLGTSSSGTAVRGTSTAGTGGFFSTSNGSNGVYGASNGSGGNGGYFVASVGINAYGVEGNSAPGVGVVGVSSTGTGVYGYSASGSAGVFDGHVKINGSLNVTGAITAGTKDFKIDDPLDPANKFLYHASVESDKMEDVYHGHVILDANGKATVDLPGWFEALNKDCEYTLTCVGGFAPVYVAQEIQNNRFTIAGGRSGLKVSWQVTGVRQDAYASAHPLQVEEEKPVNEQGLYLHPKEWGQPEELGIGYAEHQTHTARATKQP